MISSQPSAFSRGVASVTGGGRLCFLQPVTHDRNVSADIEPLLCAVAALEGKRIRKLAVVNDLAYRFSKGPVITGFNQ